MGFSKTGCIYKISRMTGNRDSFLGISFTEDSKDDIKVIEVEIKHPKNIKNNPSKDEVLEQVLIGLKLINKSLKTNYKLSHIYYVPSSDSVYQDLIQRLIVHYHLEKEFKEI